MHVGAGGDARQGARRTPGAWSPPRDGHGVGTASEQDAARRAECIDEMTGG